MPIEETGKRKAARIPLDYHQRRDRVARGKLALAVVALAIAGGWAALAALRPGDYFAPGPVAAVHATWETECAACHTPFAPILTGAVRLSAELPTSVDAKCQVCHRVGIHHAAQKLDDVRRCSTCHLEHLGRDARITRVADQSCIRCHAALAEHTARPAVLTTSGPYASAKVTGFNLHDHPRFRSARSDPGKLKFSHRRHLAPGLNLGSGDRFAPRRMNDLPESYRARYATAGQRADSPIQLDCAACHQLDATGAYLRPVSFDNHCRACHPLNYEPASGVAAASQSIEHGLKPGQMATYLQAVYTSAYLDSDADLFQTPAPRRPLPGKPATAETPPAKAAIREQVARADMYLRGRCQQCHELAGTPTQAAVEPTNVPSVWLVDARFDHSAHRAVECRVCHQQSYLYEPWKAGGDQLALDNGDVLLPRLEVCTACHAPRNDKSARGGARFDCVECHAYHGVDQSQIARRNGSREKTRRWPLDEFLRGPLPGKVP